MKFEGYTGRSFENDILLPLPDSWRNEGYFNEEKSYQWVRDHQPWNPSDPTVKVANELHFQVASAMGLEDVNELKLYTALNSPLDYHFGIDAFFEIDGETFTLDFSVNPHKEEAKADMVLHELDVLTEKGMEEAAATIAKYLGRRRIDHASLKKVA